MSDDKAFQMVRIATYDPLLLKEKNFLAGFVAREQELNKLHRVVKEASGKGQTKHCLLYGQRGMGKTSLLRRLAILIRENQALSTHWIPVNFTEEQYNINHLADFWANCADGLAQWCEDNGHDSDASLLDQQVDDKTDLWPTIEVTAQKHNRRLVLLVDNLQGLFAALPEKDHWALREKLQAQGGPLLIAASPELPEQLANREAAFYEFFQLLDLKALSLAEMQASIEKIAISRGKRGEAVLKEIRRNRVQIKVLHILCGGNPRTLAFIYQVLETVTSLTVTEKSDTEPSNFIDMLEGVLESTTPLYKARTDNLPLQQQQIIDAIALNWNPISLKTLAEVTDLPTTSLSSQLRRMKMEGLIETVKLKGKQRGYQITERLYNIWYLMRRGKRRSKTRLQWLTAFLCSYFSLEELNHQSLESAPLKSLERAGSALRQGNLGQATDLLADVFASDDQTLWSAYKEDLFRLTRLFKQLRFDAFYLQWLEHSGWAMKMQPYAVAVEAFFADKSAEDVLNSTNPEVRYLAEPMYRWLAALPEGGEE